MIKPNKNLLSFLTLSLTLGVSTITVLNKFRPLLLEHSVYYCQQFLQAFSIKIPPQSGFIIVGIVLTLLTLAVMKLVITFFEVRRLRLRLTKQVKQHSQIKFLLNRLDLQNKVYIFSSQKLLAFCFGIRNPKIYVSTKILSTMTPKELEAILLHEKYHLENKDNFILLFAHTTSMLFPFFPLLSDLIHQYRIKREIEADRLAIKEMGDKIPMITVLSKLLSIPALSRLPVSALGDFDTLEERIRVLKNDHKGFKRLSKLNLVISLLSVGVLATIIITPVQAVAIQGMGRNNTTMLCLSGDSCASWCKEHNTVVPFSSSVNASHNYSPAQ